MLDIIEVQGHYYVRAQSSLTDTQTKTLMSENIFGVFDRRGDFRTMVSTEQGLFYREMRHLSKLVLSLGEDALLLLSSSVKLDNSVLEVDLTNAKAASPGESRLAGTLHLYRSNYLWENSCYQLVEVHNYALESVALELILDFEADFADIFEVRGHTRKIRGQLLEPRVGKSAVVLGYLGLDGLRRETRVELSLVPAAITANQIRVPLRLEPGEQKNFSVRVQCSSGDETTRFYSEQEAAEKLNIRKSKIAEVQMSSSNEGFNDWINRSVADLGMLLATTPEGIYPFAGVPWFSTIFGRDGILTGLQYLWAFPEVAKGVLSYLASTQATENNASQDAEPGKILHETRQSEMAQIGEVPFRRYYGSVDSTPLFILLAAAYFKRTGDRELLVRIWPNIENALRWIDEYGDRDGDGFVEYGRFNPHGLLQQGWKDSQDSIFHADGSIAKGPIALCEVQGYVHAAKREISDVFKELNQTEPAEELLQAAETLKRRFHQAFWCEKISSYAIALDGAKQRCEIRSSNAGHTLFTGIAREDHAEKIIAELTTEKYFSGWGIRTIATGEARYNPMSYHNGSIWPHDNALIASGLGRAKNKSLAGRILTGLFEASLYLDLHRLPELFCGFSRQPGKAPTLYPVACSPQAWATGAVFMMLQACLGMEILAGQRLVRFVYPTLPESIPSLQIRGLRVGSALIDLDFIRHERTVEISAPHRLGEVEIVMINGESSHPEVI